MERMGLHDLEPGEQRMEIGQDHFLEPDENLARPFSIVILGNQNELLNRIRDFHTREMLDALLIPYDDGEIEAQVRNMWEGAAAIEGERREHRVNALVEIALQFAFAGRNSGSRS